MNPITAAVKQVFDIDGWNTEIAPGDDIIYSKYICDKGEWIFYARTSIDAVAFYSLYPARVPVEKRDEIIKLLTMLNDGLILGNFELNFENDEIRFKTSMDLKHVEINDKICRSLLYNNLDQMEKNIEAINALISSDFHKSDIN